MPKQTMSDSKILFKIALPLIVVGIVLAAVGESYWSPLFWVGLTIILIGVLIAWLSTTFPF
jgi:hypothetical protein